MYHIMQKQQRYLLLKSCDTNALAPRCLLLCVPRENTLPADLSIDCLANRSRPGPPLPRLKPGFRLAEAGRWRCLDRSPAWAPSTGSPPHEAVVAGSALA